MQSDCELNPYVPFCPASDYRRFAARRPDYGEIITDEHLWCVAASRALAVLPFGSEGRSRRPPPVSSNKRFDAAGVFREPPAACFRVGLEGELHIARQPSFGFLPAVTGDEVADELLLDLCRGGHVGVGHTRRGAGCGSDNRCGKRARDDRGSGR